MYVLSEVHTSGGRCDCVVQTTSYVYLFEFKLDHSAEEALQQINDRDYTGKYRAGSRKIIKIGVSFESSQHNISSWKTEEE